MNFLIIPGILAIGWVWGALISSLVQTNKVSRSMGLIFVLVGTYIIYKFGCWCMGWPL
jgi:hypothetical protein